MNWMLLYGIRTSKGITLNIRICDPGALFPRNGFPTSNVGNTIYGRSIDETYLKCQDSLSCFWLPGQQNQTYVCMAGLNWRIRVYSAVTFRKRHRGNTLCIAYLLLGKDIWGLLQALGICRLLGNTIYWKS